MKERPILFNAEMVRAILEGRKTQTRRIMKPQPPAETVAVCTYHHPSTHPHFYANDGVSILDWSNTCPFGQKGDHLWVRETFCQIYPQEQNYNDGRPIEYDYRATYTNGYRLGDSLGIKKKWTPSIHMPRWASRITLEITNVRVERLQDIDQAGAQAEGWNPFAEGSRNPAPFDPRRWFQQLWDQINGTKSWDANHWVWVVEFRRIL